MIGTRIRTLIDDCDTDEQGRERRIPAGTIGTVRAVDGELHDIVWDGGGWTRWTAEEIGRDAVVVEEHS